MGATQDSDSSIRVYSVIEYILAGGTDRPKLPTVTVVTDVEAGVGGIRRAAEGMMSLEKLVLKHPLSSYFLT